MSPSIVKQVKNHTNFEFLEKTIRDLIKKLKPADLSVKDVLKGLNEDGMTLKDVLKILNKDDMTVKEIFESLIQEKEYFETQGKNSDKNMEIKYHEGD